MTGAAFPLPADGLHSVDYATYSSWDAVGNTSVLKKMRRSPLYCHETRGKDAGSSDAKDAGRALHALLLDPGSFNEQFVIGGRCVGVTEKNGPCKSNGSVIVSGRSYCGTHVKALGEVEKDPRTPLTQEEVARLRRMVDAIHGDADACKILDACTEREVSILWTDKRTGLRCKGRADLFGEYPTGAFLWEVKKSIHAHPDGFEREILRLGYHLQLAWYDAGLRALGFYPECVGILAVNDCKGDDVHEVGVYDLIADALELGREKNRATLDEYAECVRSGKWRGFGRRPISVPTYALGVMDDESNDNETEV